MQQQQRRRQVVVAPPTTFVDLVRDISMQCAREYLLFSIKKRAIIYTCIVCILSIVTTVMPFAPYDFYFNQRHNVLNVYFVKFGWFWTFSLTGVFIYMTSRVYTGARYTTVLRHLFRLIVGTAIWYLVTGAILQYEKFTEKCDGFATKSRTKCREHGGIWTPGFDISGHCFLLIYCSLLIAEEVKIFAKWLRLGELLDELDRTPRQTRDVHLVPASNDYRRHAIALQISFFTIFLLQLTWDFMLVISSIYYHDFASKLAGTIVALFCWLLTYRCWYVHHFPGLPGVNAIVNFIR